MTIIPKWCESGYGCHSQNWVLAQTQWPTVNPLTSIIFFFSWFPRFVKTFIQSEPYWATLQLRCFWNNNTINTIIGARVSSNLYDIACLRHSEILTLRHKPYRETSKSLVFVSPAISIASANIDHFIFLKDKSKIESKIECWNFNVQLRKSYKHNDDLPWGFSASSEIPKIQKSFFDWPVRVDVDTEEHTFAFQFHVFEETIFPRPE